MVDNASADERTAVMGSLTALADLIIGRIPAPDRVNWAAPTDYAVKVFEVANILDPGQKSPTDYAAAIATAIDLVTAADGFTPAEGRRSKGLAAMVATGLPAAELADRVISPSLFTEATVAIVAQLVCDIYREQSRIRTPEDQLGWLAYRGAQLSAVAEFVSNDGVFADTGLAVAHALTRDAVASAVATGQQVRIPEPAVVAAAAMAEALDRGLLPGRTSQIRVNSLGGYLLTENFVPRGVEVVTTFPGLLVAVADFDHHLASAARDVIDRDVIALDRLDALRARIPEIFDNLDTPAARRATDALEVVRLDPNRFCSPGLASDLADPTRYVQAAGWWINECQEWMTAGPARGENPTAWQGKALVWADTITAAISHLPTASAGQVYTGHAAAAAERLHAHCATWIQVGLDTAELRTQMYRLATTADQRVAHLLEGLARIKHLRVDRSCAQTAHDLIADGQQLSADHPVFGEQAGLLRGALLATPHWHATTATGGWAVVGPDNSTLTFDGSQFTVGENCIDIEDLDQVLTTAATAEAGTAQPAGTAPVSMLSAATETGAENSGDTVTLG